MRLALVATTLLLGCSPSLAEQPNCIDRLGASSKDSAVRPTLVLLQGDPWANVMGSESPRFALYSDGQAIYRTPAGLRSVHLTAEEADRLRARVNVDALACRLGSYRASYATDQPHVVMLIGRGGKLSPLTVYGRPKHPEAPTAAVAAYEVLSSFSHPSGRPWLPRKVEVMIWPYDYAPGPSVAWPKEWPGLEDPQTRRRGDSYSLYLPAAEYPRLVDLMKSRSKKGAIEIGGRKWAIDVRFPFPSEDAWMEALAESPVQDQSADQLVGAVR